MCGGSVCDEDTAAAAAEVGRRLAEAGAVLLTGGRGGVMESASRGAADAGGLVIGILPGTGRRDANPYLTAAVATGMGEMRNAVLVNAADAVIAIDGEYGTLSEVAFALRTGKTVVGLETWELRRRGAWDEGIVRASTPEDAVQAALARGAG